MTAKIPAENQRLAHIAPLFAGWEKTLIFSLPCGLGAAVLWNGQLVAGASSYTSIRAALKLRLIRNRNIGAGGWRQPVGRH